MLARWKKLVWNIPFSGLSVVLHAMTDWIMGNPETRQLSISLMREVVRGAAAIGRTIPEEFVQKMIADTDKMPPYRTSMMIDYDSRKPMEVEAIFGNPLRTARDAGAELPGVEMLYQQLKFLDAGNRARLVAQVTSRGGRALRPPRPLRDTEHRPPHRRPREREVVSNGVIRTDDAKRLRHFERRFQVGLFPSRQAEGARDPVHVNIQRHDELRGRHLPPKPGIHVVLPDHPPQEQVQPLARTALAGARKQVPARRRTAPPENGDPGGQRREDRLVPFTHPREEAPLQRAVFEDGPTERRSRAARSPPRVHRCVNPLNAEAISAGDESRTKRAGDGPILPSASAPLATICFTPP